MFEDEKNKVVILMKADSVFYSKRLDLTKKRIRDRDTNRKATDIAKELEKKTVAWSDSSVSQALETMREQGPSLRRKAETSDDAKQSWESMVTEAHSRGMEVAATMTPEKYSKLGEEKGTAAQAVVDFLDSAIRALPGADAQQQALKDEREKLTKMMANIEEEEDLGELFQAVAKWQKDWARKSLEDATEKARAMKGHTLNAEFEANAAKAVHDVVDFVRKMGDGDVLTHGVASNAVKALELVTNLQALFPKTPTSKELKKTVDEDIEEAKFLRWGSFIAESRFEAKSAVSSQKKSEIDQALRVLHTASKDKPKPSAKLGDAKSKTLLQMYTKLEKMSVT